MGLKNVIKNILKPSEKKKIVNSDDSYCYSKIIWNSKDNLIILLSFTEDYFASIIELQDAMLKRFWGFESEVVFSSYDEETDKIDEDGNKLWIIHNKYYILIGGEPFHDWVELYTKIHNLGNEALARITDEIVNNCYAEDYKKLIEDGILYNFKYVDTEPEYDKNKIVDGVQYTDPKVLLERIPTGFTARELLPFIRISRVSGTGIITNAFNELIANSRYFYDESILKNLYIDLFGENITSEKLLSFTEPLYKQPDDDSLPGNVDDESLDAIFRENYDRFSAVHDDGTYYEDIDEELNEDEESDNMRKEDIIE